jgi:hypothetical protein
MRGWPTLVCAGLAVLACGGRTASDFGDYGSGGSGDGSNGGTGNTGNTGNSSSGGTGAIGGKGGTGATGATSGTGGSGGSINDGGGAGIGTGGGGTGGVGAAGSGGIAGSGGVAGTGAIMETCNSLCKDFTTVCPGQPLGGQNCSGQCSGAVITSPPQCQASTVNALACLDKAILGLGGLGLSCEQALTFATFNCGAAFLEAQNCSGPSNPGCSGQRMASDSSCTTALDCGSTFYSVSCQSLPDGTSACSCSQSMGSTGQGSAVRVAGLGAPACAQAWQQCGFPSDTPGLPL